MVYHGLTSLTQGPELTDDAASTLLAPTSTDMSDPAFTPLLQALAASKHVSVAPTIGDALLDCYFTFQVFNVVNKSNFVRDMALGGPFFSEFLLMCLYASGTRMIDGLDPSEREAQAGLFARLARDLLAKEMEGPSKIATVEGLLLLSMRECALGNVSQGWNYSGLVSLRIAPVPQPSNSQAFRQIHDVIYRDRGDSQS